MVCSIDDIVSRRPGKTIPILRFFIFLYLSPSLFITHTYTHFFKLIV